MFKISVIIITYNRKKELVECIENILCLNPLPFEIIILDNCSDDGSREILKANKIFHHDNIQIIESETNLGVAGGRNLAIKHSNGDLLLFLDDDAIIEPVDVVNVINDYFSSIQNLGVLAVRIINYFSKTIQREEFPHKNKKLYNESEFYTSYYVGAGHVIPKRIFDDCGYYTDDFFYGMEELDLSMRIIKQGYDILYTNKITVYHKKALTGRISDKKKYEVILRNRLIIAYKYFSYYHIIVTFIIWSLKTIIDSKDITIVFKAVKQFFRYKKNVKKIVLDKNTMKRISSLKGRIWY